MFSKSENSREEGIESSIIRILDGNDTGRRDVADATQMDNRTDKAPDVPEPGGGIKLYWI